MERTAGLILLLLGSLTIPFAEDEAVGRTVCDFGSFTAKTTSVLEHEWTENDRLAVLEKLARTGIISLDRPTAIRLKQYRKNVELHFATEGRIKSRPKVLGSWRRAFVEFGSAPDVQRLGNLSFGLCDRNFKVLAVVSRLKLPKALQMGMRTELHGKLECLAASTVKPAAVQAAVAILQRKGMIPPGGATVSLVLRPGKTLVSLMVRDDARMSPELNDGRSRIEHDLARAGVFDKGLAVEVQLINSAFDPIAAEAGSAAPKTGSLASLLSRSERRNGAGLPVGTWSELVSVILLAILGVALALDLGYKLWVIARHGLYTTLEGNRLFYSGDFTSAERKLAGRLLLKNGVFTYHEPRTARIHETDDGPEVEVTVHDQALSSPELDATHLKLLLAFQLNAARFRDRLFILSVVDSDGSQSRRYTTNDLPELIRPPLTSLKRGRKELFFGPKVPVEAAKSLLESLATRLDTLTSSARPSLLAVRVFGGVGVLIARVDPSHDSAAELREMLIETLTTDGDALFPGIGPREVRLIDDEHATIEIIPVS